jgi:tRNA pseudouridine55 synthase
MSANPPKNRNILNSWLILDKPLGITSNDAVMRVKRLLRPSKIGHTGTLDPLASGMLPLALGEGTKCVSLLMDAKKTYAFTIRFGEERSTDDAEGEVSATSDVRPTEAEIRAVLPEFTGPIQQIPPAFSALKINGERAYKLARAGEEVVMQPRGVTIHALNMTGFTGDTASFEATVSKGTYIRALGSDIARRLGSCAYISMLRRTAIGGFSEATMISLDFLEKTVHTPATIMENASWLHPLTLALDGIPANEVDAATWQDLRHGKAISLPISMPPIAPMAITHRGILVALGEWDGARFQPGRLLHTLTS